MGTEFKTICCGVTGALLHIEICRGNQDSVEVQYNRELGSTAGCCIRLFNETKGCGQRKVNGDFAFVYINGGPTPRESFIGD